MTLAIISHPDCLLHDAGEMHPECPERVKVIQSALENFDFKVRKQFYPAPFAHRDQLLAVHNTRYVDWLFAHAPEKGALAIDNDTWMNPHSLNAALRAAGAVPFAVDLVMRDEAQAVFCNIRPPGHHAERNKAMGFCFFNNVAVGVKHAMLEYELERIVIVDFDVHHGNGTQNIFQREKKVMYCSSFQDPFYPGYNPDLDNKHILSVPLPAGSSGEIFREKVALAWLDKIEKFAPQLIIFSAGFDGHINDRLANMHLLQEDYVWLTQQIAAIAKIHASNRMVSVLEGGYNLNALAECVPAHVDAMIFKP